MADTIVTSLVVRRASDVVEYRDRVREISNSMKIEHRVIVSKNDNGTFTLEIVTDDSNISQSYYTELETAIWNVEVNTLLLDVEETFRGTVYVS